MVSIDLQEQPVDRLSPADPLRRAMLHAIPELRSLALQFCGRPEKADTLVQQTLVRGLAQIESFEPGSEHEGLAGRDFAESFLQTSYGLKLIAIPRGSPPEQDWNVRIREAGELSRSLVREWMA
jgi:RNA polymerase sigma-70 factor, ECF subfamily